MGLATAFCLSTVYGLYGLMSGLISDMPTWLAALYNAMSRPVFTVGIAIVTYLCANRYASKHG
ncbi:unnamed protein product [Echinostoma caproni]|uniref:Uncharacterized protein n=1 Tax=Echinostoma caproni TaxID=27848 RepID=A0A3P8HDU7_9TREM|nr:unnamed protein product [Echinostoma caproni]